MLPNIFWSRTDYISGAYATKMVAISSPAQHPPTSTNYYESTSPPEVWDLLVSDASWCHHREALNHSPEHSRSPFLTGGMIFPPPSGMLDPCQFSSNNWKLISTLLDFILNLKKIYLSLLFSPSLASLYLFEQCLRLGVTSTFSVCLRWIALCIPQL